jgi:hypothetical protein
MGFALFILVNAVLLIRPAEVVPELLGLPLYEVVILACFAVNFPQVAEQLSPRALVERPITACVLALLVAIGLSHVSNFYLGGARESGVEFLKVVLYYLLLVAVVNSPRRMRLFLMWLVALIGVLTVIALLQFYEVIELPALTQAAKVAGEAELGQGQERATDPVTGLEITQARLLSTGLFNNPNDLSRILAVAVPLCLYFLFDPSLGLFRVLWLAPTALFTFAIYLTDSRGGIIGLVAGLGVLFHARFGTAKTLLLAVPLAAAVLVVMMERQTETAAGISTSQQRIQLWSEGLDMFREAPFFGIGADTFVDRARLVAHNSFVHCFAELGFFGGTLFLGAWLIALWGLYRCGPPRAVLLDPEQRRLRPYLLAVVVATAVGMLTSSRSYVVPTYLVLGSAAAFLRFTPSSPPLPSLRLNGELLQRVALAGVAFMAATYLFVRLFVRWS